MKKIIPILIMLGFILPSFCFVQAQALEQPETLGEAREMGEKVGGELKSKMPGTIEKIWKEEVLPFWQKMGDWFMNNIWSKVEKWFKKDVKPRVQKEVEKKKPMIEKEFQKEKEEMGKDIKEKTEEQLPEMRKTLWERFKELIK